MDTINGLPAHVLLIHLVVVLIPLAALMTVAGAVWPAARRRLGVLTPIVALVGLIAVPLTTEAGEWLEHRLTANGPNAAIERHADLGDTLLPWAIGLFVVAFAVWALGRRYDLRWGRPSADAAARVLPVWATPVVAVVALGVAVGTTITLVRIGDSGAKAAWGYVGQLK